MSLKSAPVIINSKTLQDTFHFNKDVCVTLDSISIAHIMTYFQIYSY